MEGMVFEAILGPGALLLMLGYHVFLCYKVHTSPFSTTIGAINHARHIWAIDILHSNTKKNVFAVQTLRNSIMESTLMATSAIVLAAAMGLYITFTTRYKDIVDMAVLRGGIEGGDGWAKPSILLGCFVFSFLCNAQSIRFFNDLNFLLNVPMSLGPNNTCNDKNNNVGRVVTMGEGHEEEVYDLLYRAALLNIVGSRGLYFGACLLFWVFGSLALFIFTLALIPSLYIADFLDPTPPPRV